MLPFKRNRPVYYANCVMGAAPRSKSVRAIKKIGLKYRFDYQFGRRLAHAVKNNRNSERPFLRFAWLIDVTSQHWLRPILVALQLLADFRKELFYTNNIFDVLKILFIESRCPFVGLYSLPGLQYYILHLHDISYRKALRISYPATVSLHGIV